MKLHRYIIGLIFSALLFSCGREHGNPVAPEKTAFTLSGKTCTVYGKGAGGIEVTLSGPAGELSTKSDSLGNYSFPELPAGEYALAVRGQDWVAAPDSIPVGIGNADVGADDFFCARKSQVRNTCYLCGRVNLPEGEIIPGLSIRYMSKDTGSRSYSAVLEKDGRFYAEVKPGKSYVLRPSLTDFAYTVSPDSAEVTTDRPIAVRTFTARRSTAPLHTISGRLMDREGNPLVNPVRFECRNVKNYVHSDSTGAFAISAPDGDYILEFIDAGYLFTPSRIQVTVKGNDIVLPDMVGVYNDYTIYAINGRVIDRYGIGVPDVWVDLEIPWGSSRTRADGTYQAKAGVGRGTPDRVILALHPRKEGAQFTPDSLSVILDWQPGIEDGGVVSVPDFICLDYSVFTAADHFPLGAGSSWTYSRTVNSDPPAELTMRVSGTISTAGNSYYRFVNSWMSGRTDFRIDGNTVHTVQNGADVAFLRFGALPGAKWDIGKSSGNYPVTGTFVGLDTVTVPAGTFTDCLKYEILTVYGETSREQYTFWLAKERGMVKSVKTLINYGVMREVVIDELKGSSS